MTGGMHGGGACMAGGHEWQGACVAGGQAWQGGMRGRRDGHWHCCGQYASYWNAFLLFHIVKARLKFAVQHS